MILGGGTADIGAPAAAPVRRNSRIARKFRSTASRSTRATVQRIMARRASRALGEICEACLLPEEGEAYHARRPVTLFGQDQLRRAGIGAVLVLVVDIISIDEDHDVGVLLEGTRL